jgi:hypothetical protein
MVDDLHCYYQTRRNAIRRRETDLMSYLAYRTTNHAERRVRQRGIQGCAIEAALTYGRRIRRPGAVVHVIGRKEVERWRARGVNLSDYVNLQVVCATDGAIITVYRNSNLHQLRRWRPYAEKETG